jgi:hypothetical protein
MLVEIFRTRRTSGLETPTHWVRVHVGDVSRWMVLKWGNWASQASRRQLQNLMELYVWTVVGAKDGRCPTLVHAVTGSSYGWMTDIMLVSHFSISFIPFSMNKQTSLHRRA